jgi:hypothetical protein
MKTLEQIITESPLSGKELHSKIVDHLRKGGSVIILSYTGNRIYKGVKHVEVESFRAPKKDTETGVYVRRGKGYDYVFPQSIAFG